MPRRRITYIVSRIDRALEFEWVAEYLNREKFELSFIIIGPLVNTRLKQRLIELDIKCVEIYIQSKLHYPSAIYKTYRALKLLKPDIIHCHLIDATLIGLYAGRLAGVKSKIYTRHHSTFHHQYAKHAIKYDIWANRNADKIVAISSNVYHILTDVEHAEENKVTIIPHGFPESTFVQASVEQINVIKNKYILHGRFPVVGVVSRYDKWKGVEYVIHAFQLILSQFPSAKLVLANASKGDDVLNISEKLKSLPTDSFCEIEFEQDNKSLFKAMDVFVHVPVDSESEAFGQVYIEAMAQHVPVVATLSGVGNEVIDHKITGYVVDYKNSKDIVDGVEFMINNKIDAKNMAERAYNLVSSTYTLKNKLNLLENLYNAE